MYWSRTMKNKIVVLLEILLIGGALLYYTIFVMIPDYKKSLGSSDRFVKSRLYQNMVEIEIDGKTDFALLFNQEEEIYHMFFFDNSSVFLYNKNIENQSIENGLERIFPILIENQLLHEKSSVVIYRDQDTYYDVFKNNWDQLLLKYSITTETFEKVKKIEDKARELDISTESLSSMLLEMDFYSKEIVKDSDLEEIVLLNDETSKEFSNHVYHKIEDMVFKKQIKNQNRDEVDINISLVPADSKMQYYPTSNSWYYVLDGKVYAMIEFTDGVKKYTYCYQGSIDSRTEGECKS